MDLNKFIADADAFIAEEMAAHFGDRYTHMVILADCSIVREHPESEDFNGEMVATRRTTVEAGCSIDLGREYHVPVGVDAYAARNALMVSA